MGSRSLTRFLSAFIVTASVLLILYMSVWMWQTFDHKQPNLQAPKHTTTVRLTRPKTIDLFGMNCTVTPHGGLYCNPYDTTTHVSDSSNVRNSSVVTPDIVPAGPVINVFNDAIYLNRSPLLTSSPLFCLLIKLL